MSRPFEYGDQTDQWHFELLNFLPTDKFSLKDLLEILWMSRRDACFTTMLILETGTHKKKIIYHIFIKVA